MLDTATPSASAAAAGNGADPLLSVEDLHVHFRTSAGIVRAVEGVSFTVKRGEVVAIVGESGSGKSVSALSVMRLLPRRSALVPQGRVLFEGRDLLGLDDEQMREIRGRHISMIFQEPMTSLNPVLSIGLQITEPLQIHLGMDDTAARARAVELMKLVGIPDAERRLDQFPHQFSGGMRQRVMIAMALACQPRLLIADEPTTALDVTIQAQILELIAELRHKLGMALLLITHDMGVIAESVDRVAVMYAARVIETAPVDALFRSPLHPYTRGLLKSIPRRGSANQARERLAQIPGTVPTLALPLAPGCRFAPRCDQATARCTTQTPTLVEVRPGHRVACLEVGP